MTAQQKLDPVIKCAWVQALRSGNYEQGKGLLYRDGGYCCLGVLARAVGRPIEIIADKPCLSQRDSEAFFPGDLDREIQSRLECMNDGTEGFKRHSFEEIATWIDVHL